MHTKWSDMPELPVFFDRYIQKVDDLPLMEAFEAHSPSAILADMEKLKALGDQVYASDKWTVKDILLHIIDTERILSYRALRFSRNDQTKLPGFEENLYAVNTTASNRTIEDLIAEWEALRMASVALFKYCSIEMLDRKGISFDSTISVRALGFTILGHSIHHYRVLEERYFSLLG